MALTQVQQGMVGTQTSIPMTYGAIGSGNSSIMKNRIINGAMVIDQRNAGANGTATGYTLDRWQYAASQATKGTWGQNFGGSSTPAGFTNYLGFQTGGSAVTLGATDYFYLSQKIEGYNIADLAWGSASAKTVTLSFWVLSSLTGTFGGALQNSASTQNYPFSYSIPVANTWTQISVTIAGPTSGTWQTTNNSGIQVIFSLGMGSTYSGTAGSWTSSNIASVTGAVNVLGTVSASWYATGVQLEVGSSATGFEYVNYQTSLANCQRYYETSFPVGNAVPTAIKVGTINTTGITASSNRPFWFVPFQTSKRANPTVVVYNGVNTTAGQVGGPSNSAYNATTQNQASNGFQVYQSQTTATADGDYYVHFSASAEL